MDQLPDSNTGWWAGLGSVALAVVFWLDRRISNLWRHVNESDQKAADHRVDDAKEFATKEDLNQLDARIVSHFSEHERHMTAIFRAELGNRRPIVKDGQE